MRLSESFAVTTLLGLLFPISALAQESTTSIVDEDVIDPADSGDTIVVQGTKQRGAVLGDIAPDTVLYETDIAAYGVSNLAELLVELEAETGSSRGRSNDGPVVLLNGRRISGFREIRRYPPESVQRVEILPEEAALQYGFKADQRVVNIILKDNFSSRIVEAGFEGATAGGWIVSEYEAGSFFIDGPSRWNLSGEIELSPALTEAERDIISSGTILPYDSFRNIAAAEFGTEISSHLSGLAGETVTTAAVPRGVSTPGFSDFLDGANETNETDLTQFRTLRSEQERIEIDASMARDINDAWGLTFSAGVDIDNSTSLQGLAGTGLDVPANSAFNPFTEDIVLYRYADSLGALKRVSDTASGSLSLTANRQTARWVTTLTANANYSSTNTDTDRQADIGDLQDLISANEPNINPYTIDLGSQFETDLSETRTTSYDTTIVMTGPVLDLYAGEVRTTLTGEVSLQDIVSKTLISEIEEKTDLSRESIIIRGSFDIPLRRAKNYSEWGLGDLAVNLNAAVDDLSDFGSLYTYGYGITWQPRPRLNLIASITEEDGAPTIAQLGNPLTLTENERVYDYILAETVFVTTASGGNTELDADHRCVFKLGANWQPYDETDLIFRADYTESLIEDPVGTISSASAEIQAALPDRFVRDDEGNLIFVDTTPFNYVESQKRDLRSGLTYSKRFGSTSRRGPMGASAGGPPRGGRSRPPSGNSPRSSAGAFRLSVFHTYALEDRILIREGIEEINLLGGAAISASGGSPEHEISVRANLFYKGLGARSHWNWQSGTEVIDLSANSGLDLNFSAIGTFDINLFVDFNQRGGMLEKYPFLKNMRASLDVDNIFNTRQTVRDSTGEEPLQYQENLIDPIGRTTGINFRKSF